MSSSCDWNQRLDDKIGYFVMAPSDVGEGKSETPHMVVKLPARYGDMRAICEARNKQELGT